MGGKDSDVGPGRVQGKNNGAVHHYYNYDMTPSGEMKNTNDDDDQK